MSEPRIVPFPAAASEAEAPGITSRAVDINGVRWAVVEYEPDVLREDWCDEGHSGYAIDGEVVYEFEDGGPPLEVRAGGVHVARRQAPPWPRRDVRGAAVPDRPSRLRGAAAVLDNAAHSP